MVRPLVSAQRTRACPKLTTAKQGQKEQDESLRQDNSHSPSPRGPLCPALNFFLNPFNLLICFFLFNLSCGSIHFVESTSRLALKSCKHETTSSLISSYPSGWTRFPFAKRAHRCTLRSVHFALKDSL